MQWEYKQVSVPPDMTGQAAELNRLGMDGWELVQFGRDGSAILKRPKAESVQNMSRKNRDTLKT